MRIHLCKLVSGFLFIILLWFVFEASLNNVCLFFKERDNFNHFYSCWMLNSANAVLIISEITILKCRYGFFSAVLLITLSIIYRLLSINVNR